MKDQGAVRPAARRGVTPVKDQDPRLGGEAAAEATLFAGRRRAGGGGTNHTG